MERDYAISLADQYGLFPKIVSIVRDSHDEYLTTVPPEIRARQDSASRAHFIHRNVVFHLLTRIGENGPVALKEFRRLKYLLIQGEPQSMAWRVKRVDRLSLRSRNYPTTQQRALESAGKLLFDNAYPTHLVVGFSESGDDANPMLERIVLSREANGRIHWWHLLWRLESQSTPIETGYDQPVLPPWQIKPKKIDTQKRADDGTDAQKQGTDD